MRRNFSSLPFIALLALSITLSACGSNVQSSQPSAAPQSAVRPGVFLTENRRLYMVNEQVGWAIGGKQNQTIISGFEFSTLLHTTDGGKTWQQINYAVDGIGDVYILDERTAWGLAGNAQITSLYRTVDGGKTWQKFPAPVGYIPSSTTFIDASHGWVVSAPCSAPKAMNRDDYLKLCGQAPPQWSLLQTGDGGKTWKKVYTAFGDGFSTMQFFDQQTGFTTAGSQFPGDEGHLSVTRDGGRTWKQHTLLIPAPEGVDKESLFVSRPAFLNEKDGYLVATFTSQTKQVYYLYMTHDGGSTWQISGPALPNDAVDRFLDAQHIVVTINPGDGEVHMLLLTLQNGKWVTTVARPAGKDALMDGSFVSAQIGIALVATNRTIDVYKTDDGGQTWQKISTL